MDLLQRKVYTIRKQGKGSPYSITERRVPELISVLGSQLAGAVSHKPGDRLPLLSSRPAVTPATLKRAAANFAVYIAKFHYTGPTGPDRTRTDFFAARVSEKLRWVRAGLRQSPCGSARVRSGQCSGI